MPIEDLWFEIQRIVDGEVWRDIKGYGGRYRVSNFGRVYSTQLEKYLAPADNGNGYLKVHLYDNGKLRNRYIHRLVAEAFIPNPEGYLEVDHISTNKQDNRVCNLRWATREQNVNNPISIGNRIINEYTVIFNDGKTAKYRTKEFLELLKVRDKFYIYKYMKSGFPKELNIRSCIKEKIKNSPI